MKERLKQWIEELEMTIQEKKRIGWIVMVSVVLCCAVLVWDNIPFSGVLHRNTYGDGNRIEALMLSVDGLFKKEILEVEVQEQQYTSEEVDAIFTWCISNMDAWILGENISLNHVDSRLNLITEIQEYPIVIEWTWSPYSALNTSGELQESEIAEDGTLIELIGTISYGEQQTQYIRNLYLMRPQASEAEQVLSQITEEIEKENRESTKETSFQLPSSVDGHEVSWYRATSYRGLAILMLGVASSLLLLWKKKQEKEEVVEERNTQMLLDYPEIVHLFVLYIGAGMTVKNAWYRIVSWYEEQGVERYAYEEMKYTAMEMKNGVSEIGCYENFGQKCGIRCYRRFALLLMQNVRKGTKGMGEMLEVEAAEAFQERKNRTKQMAEKAGTKLLMPMVLMLAVVLTIIVVPAFLSIQL